MFVCFNDDHDLTSKYIKSVTYHLHPTFKVNKIKLTEAPFLLSRVGWGYFEIQMDIEFQEWTKLKTLRMEHMLSFDNMGHTQSILLEITEKAGGAEDKQIADSLVKEMQKLKIKK